MSEVKIGVSAGVNGVDAAIAKITSSMNKLGAAVAANQKLRFEPIGVKDMERDLALVNKQFQETLRLSAQLRTALKASGQSHASLSQIDWSKTSTDPRAAQRLRDRAFAHSVRGTALDATLSNEVDGSGNIIPPAAGGGAGGSGGGAGGGSGRRPPRGGGHGGGGRGAGGGGEGDEGEGRGSWWSRRPKGGFRSAAAEAIGNGIGGTAGNLITASASGGLPGLAFAGVTAAIGAIKQFASEGMDLAKQQNESADGLKRSLGDLGISFKGLTDDSRVFGQQIGIAGGEFLKLEQQANNASGGLYRTPEELAKATLSGGDLARAYGMQPAQGVNFVAGMDRLNNRQNNKELAAQLAEAIVNTQGKAMPGEVMQAMQGFAAAQNRFNSGSVDLNRFGNAYGSMLGVGNMTADHASDILGTANASMQRMGGTEASKNFTMQQFGMDPIRAAMRAEGGLFGNGLDNLDISGYMSQHGIKNWDSQGKGPAGTNFGVMRGAFKNAYAGRGQYGAEMELDAEKNYFGLRSYADTASFMNMSDSDHNGISGVLKNAGLNIGDVREGGLQAIAGISKANSFDDLDKLYKGSIRGRGDMSPADLSTLDKAEKGGNFQQFQNELVRVLAGKGQEDDQATTQRSIDANIENMKSNIGEKLVPYAQKAMEGIVWMANKLGAGISDPHAEGGSMFVGPGKPAAGPDGFSRRGDGLHTATGDTLLDKGIDAAASGLNWLKSQGQDGSQPLGIRNNNPLNMLTNNQENSYANPIEGIGAATANLEHGYRGLTLAGIEDKWTGGMRVKGNTPQSLANYMKVLTGATGLKPGDTPNLDEPKVVSALMKGMIKAENGKMPYSDDQINAGVGAGMRKIPAATKIPAKDRAAAAAGSGRALPGTTETRDTNGDIVINLSQTVNGAGGYKKLNKISTRTPLPTASGSRTPAPYIIEIPGR